MLDLSKEVPTEVQRQKKREYDRVRRANLTPEQKAKKRASDKASLQRPQVKARFQEYQKAYNRARDPLEVQRRNRAYRASLSPEERAEFLRQKLEDERFRIRNMSEEEKTRRREHLRVYFQERRAVVARLESTLTEEAWFQILDYFGHCCAYCLRSGVKLTMDHVTPVSKGGGFTAENIIPACGPCNSRKGCRPIFLMAAAHATRFDRVSVV